MEPRHTGKKKVEQLINLEKESWLSLPFMMGPGGRPVYQPYKIRDLDVLVKQLPPITEGGAAWLRKLKTLTEGEELAIRDFWAIGARCMMGEGLEDVDRAADTV